MAGTVKLPRQSTLNAYAAAGAVGASFWCLSDTPAHLWGIKGGEFVHIHYRPGGGVGNVTATIVAPAHHTGLDTAGKVARPLIVTKL